MVAVGIDVGKAALDVAFAGDRSVRRFPNTRNGIDRLLRLLREQPDVRIVVEATGGYEEAVLAACAEAGLWIARVNSNARWRRSPDAMWPAAGISRRRAWAC